MDHSIGDEQMMGPGGGEGYALNAGDVLGQYLIMRRLGRDGMGQVYKAEHTTLGRRYALKLLPEEFVRSANALERFRREAKVMANLEHPNIVRVDEFGETVHSTGSGQAVLYWLRMELVDGVGLKLETGNLKSETCVTLADLAKSMGGNIPQEMLQPILKQVLDGLAYAHAHGAVHRDLKPSNVLLKGSLNSLKPLKPLNPDDGVGGLNGAEGRFNEPGDSPPLTAMIADFGLVKLVGEEWIKSMVDLSVQHSMSIGDERTMGGKASSSSAGTSTKSLLGTYEYMSPEQKRGEDADERSDVYAVGLMVYKLLTGRELGMRTPSQIDSKLDKAWDDLVLQALEERPGDRFQSVAEVVAALPVRESGAIKIEYRISNTEYQISKGRVRIDGRAWKTVDLPYTEEGLGCERHTVELQVEHWEISSNEQGMLNVDVEDGKTAQVVFTLKPQPSAITIACNAPQAEIWQKGTAGLSLLGTAGQKLSLAPFETHQLEVSENGYKAKVVHVVLDQPGKDCGTKQVVLEKWSGPEAGRKWTAELGSGVSMDFMPIAAGSFQMGSNNGDSDEKPVHQVTLSKPFWLAKTETTQAQWQQVMGGNPSNFKGADLPVECVSWNDAMEFCRKLTERERQAGRLPEGYEYALPTEAQWEYACRAGTTGDYAGSLDAMGWYDKNSGGKTHPVGQKQANAWGLHDMHGNVWEWCSDWYGGYAAGNAVDPNGAGSGSYRVYRGGCWYYLASFCRSANRGNTDPSHAGHSLGFRPLVQQR